MGHKESDTTEQQNKKTDLYPFQIKSHFGKIGVDLSPFTYYLGFPHSSVGIESICIAGDPGLISESGRSAGEGIDYLLQYSWASLVAQLVKIHLQCRRPGSDP